MQRDAAMATTPTRHLEMTCPSYWRLTVCQATPEIKLLDISFQRWWCCRRVITRPLLKPRLAPSRYLPPSVRDRDRTGQGSVNPPSGRQPKKSPVQNLYGK